jgi:hypothetical protein
MNKTSSKRLLEARMATFPPFMNLDGFREKMVQYWNENIVLENYNNNHQNIHELPTLGFNTVIKAGDVIRKFFNQIKKYNISVLIFFFIILYIEQIIKVVTQM